MIRVLHIMAGADAGGISSVVLNYYRYIDREKFHFDIAVTTDMVGQNGKLLQELGSRIYHLPLKSQGIAVFERALENLLREETYDVIHVHESETSYVALRVAKKCGVKRRIAHSHTTAPTSTVKGELRRLSGCFFNYHYATNVVGCGQLAGERVFGKRNMRRKKACVLPNAIDTGKFCYDPCVRSEMRKTFQVEDKFVVGMVGRLARQKNYDFALELFRYVKEGIPDAHLLIAGNGPDEEKLRNYIRENDMTSYVTLLGRREDIHKLYQAFDVMIMPSLYEGFPVAAVEAMASGLPVLLADTITRELSFGSAVKYLHLKKDVWVEALKDCVNRPGREERQKEVQENGLDLHDTVHMLEQLYVTGEINDNCG